LVIDALQARDLSDGCPVTAELIGVNNFWDVVSPQQLGQEDLCRFCVALPLKEEAPHETVLDHHAPKSGSSAVHARTDLVWIPPRTPTGFPVTRAFSEEGPNFKHLSRRVS